MSALSDSSGDFLEVGLHGLGNGARQDERRANAASQPDGAEQIGALVALVGGLARPCAGSRPLAHQAVLLADACFVLEPDLNGRALRQMRRVRLQRGREVFLNAAMMRSSCLGCCGRALMWEKPSALSTLPTVRSW